VKENEKAPLLIEEKKLPDDTQFFESVAQHLRKTKGDEIHDSSTYSPPESTNQKRASAIRAKILRISYERYHDETIGDNPSRLMMTDRQLTKLILEKNSLIPKA